MAVSDLYQSRPKGKFAVRVNRGAEGFHLYEVHDTEGNPREHIFRFGTFHRDMAYWACDVLNAALDLERDV